MIDLATTNKQYLRIDELMDIFRVGRNTINNWRRSGKLVSITVGGQIRIATTEARKLAAGKLNLVHSPHKPHKDEQPQPPPT